MQDDMYDNLLGAFAKEDWKATRTELKELSHRLHNISSEKYRAYVCGLMYDAIGWTSLKSLNGSSMRNFKQAIRIATSSDYNVDKEKFVEVRRLLVFGGFSVSPEL
jgi:hypothetical protein